MGFGLFCGQVQELASPTGQGLTLEQCGIAQALGRNTCGCSDEPTLSPVQSPVMTGNTAPAEETVFCTVCFSGSPTFANIAIGGILCGEWDARARNEEFTSQECLALQTAAAVAPGNPCKCIPPATKAPTTLAPTPAPSPTPSATPSTAPSAAPSSAPFATPSAAPSMAPSAAPSAAPSKAPSGVPSAPPSESLSPSSAPSTFFCGRNYNADDITIELSSNIDCSGILPYVLLSGMDQVLDCNGFTITDTDGGAFTLIAAGGTTIRNCTIVSDATGATILIDESQADVASSGIFMLDYVTLRGQFSVSFTDALEVRLTSTNPVLTVSNSDFSMNSYGTFLATSTNTANVTIQNYISSDNSGDGIYIVGADFDAIVTLVDVTSNNNIGAAGLYFENAGKTMMNIIRSTFCGSGFDVRNVGVTILFQDQVHCNPAQSPGFTCDLPC
jgi:hypothetical protein